MKCVIGIVSLIPVLFFACGEAGYDIPSNVKEAKGGRYYGGVFALNEVDNFRSFYPPDVTQASEHRVANQIFEGLVELDQKDLMVKPGLATEWAVNNDATVYTFTIREGVKFHDDECFPDGKGRYMNAYDVEYCLRRLCTDLPNNQMFWLLQDRLKGATENFLNVPESSSKMNSISGIQAVDERTMRLELEFPFSGFLNVLSHQGCWIYPYEAVVHYDDQIRVNCVGTGPFKQKVIKENEVVILEKNPDYWQEDHLGNRLPFLNAIKVTFESEKGLELLEFRNGNLSLIYELPPEEMDLFKEALSGPKGSKVPFIKQSEPSLSIQYYGFQHQGAIFGDLNIRKAFNLAIDKVKIVDHTLGGQGIPAYYGIVPPSFNGYDNTRVHGYHYDPELARSYMVEAGYEDGKGFPSLVMQINSGGYGNIEVAEAIQSMLSVNLNIPVEISVLPAAQHYDLVEQGGADIWRAAWIADYSDPENFLNLLFGKHVPTSMDQSAYINSMRYRNSEYDIAFSKALKETKEGKRMDLYSIADSIAMQDAAIIPLYYELGIRLLHPKVRNLPMNAMEYRDLSEVYFSPLDSIF